MDISTIILIIGIASLVGGLVSGFLLYIKSIKDTAVKDAKIDILQREIEDATQLKIYIAEFVGSLKRIGYVLPAADPLRPTQADIVIEARAPESTPPAPAAPALPVVPGVPTQIIRKALLHAANRTGSRAARPFSRSYMKDVLSRSQLDKIINVLLDQGYLIQTDQDKTSPTLSPLGQQLLELVKSGKL